jgi:ABC-2 type transport system permease protein
MLTFHFVETLGQVFYRGVYEFGKLIRQGSFDGLLTKPVNTLYSTMTGHPDINDVVFLLLSGSLSMYLLTRIEITFTVTSFGLFLILLLNSFLILTGIHIFVMCFTLLTTDVDNIMFMYRDFSRLGQFPITIYHQVLSGFLFFIVPLGFMYTIPSQVLLGRTPHFSILATMAFGIAFFWLSLQAWKVTLKKYSSASS